MIVEGTGVYLGKDVAGDWIPVISFRWKSFDNDGRPTELQQAWYHRKTHETEWRGIPEVIED